MNTKNKSLASGQAADQKLKEIFFGHFAQSVKDEAVELDSKIGPDGTFLGSDGFRYLSRKAMPYSKAAIFSTGETVKKHRVYYFKLEPIRWIVLPHLSREDEVFLLSAQILENSALGKHGLIYKNSKIHSWLNLDFYNLAFSESERRRIIPSFTTSRSPYVAAALDLDKDGELPQDYVMLPSRYDITAGTGNAEDVYKPVRMAYPTDYAIAGGASTDFACGFHLQGNIYDREPTFSEANYYSSGIFGWLADTDKKHGVLPALRLRVASL